MIARRRAGRKRGSVLLVALAILALLSIFAVAIVSLTSIERQASANYLLQIEARLLAEAGVSRAMASAKEGIQTRHWAEPGDWWIHGTPWPAQGGVSNLLRTNPFGGRHQYEVTCFDLGSRLQLNQRTPGLQRALEVIGLSPAQAAELILQQDIRSGLRTHEELREILGVPTFEAVRDLISTHGLPQKLGDYRSDTNRFGDLPWAYDLPPRARSLLNINGAPEIVLAAALTELSGRPLVMGGEAIGSEWLNGMFSGARSRAAAGGSVQISAPKALELAAEIVACRTRATGPASMTTYGSGTSAPFGGPFRSWDQFEMFLGNLVPSVISPDQFGLIMAICGPDPRNMGYNPIESRRRGSPTSLFDRSSITNWTAELGLGPSGCFEVRSRGWITDDTGKLLAEAVITRVTRAFTPVHITSQRALEAVWTNKDRNIFQSMPELMTRTDIPSPADPLAGHIRLTTEALSAGGSPNLSSPFRNANPGGAFGFSRRPLPLRAGGVFGPDGVVVWRRDWGTDGAQLVSATDVPDSMSQQGSLEFWVKLANPLVGTDEVLLSLTIDDSAAWTPALRAEAEAAISGYTVPGRLGVTIKIERFGQRIRATWFYWGDEDGAVSRYVLVLAEVQKDISSWRPGAWHHVSVSWQQSPQSWPAVTAGAPITDTDTTDEIRLAIDGGGGADLEKFNYSAVQPGTSSFTLGGVTKASVGYFLGRIASILQPEGAFVGGFTLPPDPGEDIHGTGMLGNQALLRYPNATLDDVFIYDDPAGAVQRSLGLRFERNSAQVPIRLSLPIPDPTRFEVASIVLDVEVPPGCSSSVPTASPIIPRQSLPPVAGGRLGVDVVLEGNGSTSPALEGVTIYLLHTTELLEEDESADVLPVLTGNP